MTRYSLCEETLIPGVEYDPRWIREEHKLNGRIYCVSYTTAQGSLHARVEFYVDTPQVLPTLSIWQEGYMRQEFSIRPEQARRMARDFWQERHENNGFPLSGKEENINKDKGGRGDVDKTRFAEAVAAFGNAPNPDTFTSLVTAAAELLSQKTQEEGNSNDTVSWEGRPWIKVGGAHKLPEGFTCIRVAVTRHANEERDGGALSDEEIARVSGALGYALRVLVGGDELSEPSVLASHQDCTLLEYEYDTSNRVRTELDIDNLFATAAQYIVEGTPLRRTNHAGLGTMGTRLVEGIGECELDFWVLE